MARRFIHHIFLFIWEMCITEAYGQHSASNGFLIISLVVILTKKINKSEFTLKITKAGCKTYSRSEKHVKFTNNFSTHYLTPQGAMILCHIVGPKMQSLCTSRKKESKKDRKTKKQSGCSTSQVQVQTGGIFQCRCSLLAQVDKLSPCLRVCCTLVTEMMQQPGERKQKNQLGAFRVEKQHISVG